MAKGNLTKLKRRKVAAMSVIVAVRMPAALYNRLCSLKEKEYSKPISQIIREAIGDYLNKKGV